ncbi:TorF family putative porin [Acidimangrovimonas sediminis]|uniref:TorF family putative porin n=1 Tax=Acidimangrovimonas sediminis TaxID=2056283 RepID=UPI000C801E84|nr:TorF family putative porin [Acidimangrovimonas sediminis]
MKKTLLSATLALATMAGTADADTFAGVALTSNYVGGGRTQTEDKPALQTYIEQGFASGLYIGAWASNVDFGTNDTVELDLYGGYRGEIGQLSYDINYYRYLYDGDLGNCCGDAFVKVMHPVFGPVSGGIEVSSNLEDYVMYKPLLGIDLGHGFALAAEYQFGDVDNETYWKAGLSKSFDNGTSVRVEYSDRSDDESILFFTLSFDTVLLKG